MQAQLCTNDDQITIPKMSPFWINWNKFDEISSELFKPYGMEEQATPPLTSRPPE